MIHMKDYSCYYKVKEGFAVAVDDVTLDVPEGEFLVIMGESGCGKTTLLRAIAGLCDYAEGELRIDGERVERFDKRSNRIAYVSQKYTLYPHLTVYDNIAYPLRASGRKQQEVDFQVRSIAAAVGLDRLLTRLPKQLSGGQQQRLAIARALVKRPKIVLYDEPFSNVDPSMRDGLRDLIYTVCKAEGQTVLYVTHDPEDAAKLADRVVWMREGKLVHTKIPVKAPGSAFHEEKAPRTFRFFRQKYAPQDYTVDMLPHTRRQVFWDVLKIRGWSMVKLGLLLLAFSFPLSLTVLVEDVAVAQMYAASKDLTAQTLTLYFVEIRNLHALVNIPLWMLFSVGFSGAAHVIRQYAWGENASLRYDFLKGIRQNGKQMLFLFLFAGVLQWLCIYSANLTYTADGLASYLVYLPGMLALLLGLPVGAYMTACIPIYSNTLAQNLRLCAALYFQNLGRTWAVLGCGCVLFLPAWIPNFYCHFFGGLLLPILLPVWMLVWFLLCCGQLDRQVNSRFFPELVGKGLVGKRTSDRMEGGS